MNENSYYDRFNWSYGSYLAELFLNNDYNVVGVVHDIVQDVNMLQTSLLNRKTSRKKNLRLKNRGRRMGNS